MFLHAISRWMMSFACRYVKPEAIPFINPKKEISICSNLYKEGKKKRNKLTARRKYFQKRKFPKKEIVLPYVSLSFFLFLFPFFLFFFPPQEKKIPLAFRVFSSSFFQFVQTNLLRSISKSGTCIALSSEPNGKYSATIAKFGNSVQAPIRPTTFSWKRSFRISKIS